MTDVEKDPIRRGELTGYYMALSRLAGLKFPRPYQQQDLDQLSISTSCKRSRVHA